MAEEEGRTTNALAALFHDEILIYRGEVPNASFLRVTGDRQGRYVPRRILCTALSSPAQTWRLTFDFESLKATPTL